VSDAAAGRNGEPSNVNCKVEILLELQRQDLPLLRRQRPLRSWERLWNVEP